MRGKEIVTGKEILKIVMFWNCVKTNTDARFSERSNIKEKKHKDLENHNKKLLEIIYDKEGNDYSNIIANK